MNDFEYRLLDYLKRVYLKTVDSDATWRNDAVGRDRSPLQFYLATPDEGANRNLVRPMDDRHIEEYGGGAGQELKEKMHALRSSSAMTFNILGNGTCQLSHAEIGDTCSVPRGAYSIEYEYKAPTLQRRGGLPAHLDALLRHEASGTVVACEMKLMEWLTGGSKLLKSEYLYEVDYLRKDSPGKGVVQADVFASTARRLNEVAVRDGFRRYDFAQMFKHSLGLYNRLQAGAFEGSDRLVLLNCVWMPRLRGDEGLDACVSRKIEEAWREENAEFKRFRDLMCAVVELFRWSEKGIDFSIHLCTAADLIYALEYEGNERDKLVRYL